MSDSESYTDAVVIDRDDVSNYNPDHILPQDPDVVRKIRVWLGATSYDIPGGEFRKHQASHVPGTGSWLTASDTYGRWLDGGEHGLLWIKGIPGSGKSVMAANLIDRLREQYPRSPVLYFFFRQIIKANHEPRTLLRDWLDQLLEYSPPLQQELKQYEKDKKHVDSFSLEDLIRILKRAFAALPSRVFCVADALDEMDSGNESFLQMLGALGQWRPDKAKLLITSRPVPKVEGPLRKTPCLRMRLEEDMVDQDISTFVQSALAQSVIPESEWKTITDAVPGRANGLFLYAKLAMDAFLEPNADVATVLAELPADLNVLYTDLLKEHAQRSRVPPSIQHLILQSVTHATRPLRLIELAEMIRVLNPDGVHRDMKATKDLLRAACGPLLEILADETVSVIHHSFTEYLKGTTRSADGPGYPVLEYGPTHGDMAVACLRYILATKCLDDVTVSRGEEMDEFGSYIQRKGQQPEATSVVGLRLRFPFLDYAAGNWDTHLNRFEAEGPQILTNDLLDEFLGNEQRRLAWLHIKHTTERSSKIRDLNPLQAAAKTGALAYTEKLIKTAAVDSKDKKGMTALYYAAAHGHAAVVRALVAAGANPDQEDSHSGYKPLHKAASKNHHHVVRVLLENGVDPLTPKTREHPGRRCGNAPITKGETPLMYACQNGHTESVAVFMEFLDSVKTAERALGWASSHGQSKAVALILKYPGINVNAENCGITPIFQACQVRDSATAKLLLDAGANPHGLEGRPDSPRLLGSPTPVAGRRENCMHVLCGPGRGHRTYSRTDSDGDETKLFELLVAAGVDIHALSHSKRSPLHGAVKVSLVLTRLLLDAGCDANVVDENGDTPLHGCTLPEIIALLIELGEPDINARNGKGNTPLLEVMNHYNPGPMLKLLEYGPDCNIRNNKGDNALHLLLRASMAKVEVVEALLAAGADANARNMEGRTPLLSMSSISSNGGEFVECLIAHGADIEARDRKGRTLFSRIIGDFRASYSQKPHDDLDYLIKQGASLHIRDYRGRTYLFEAVGADIKDRNTSRRTSRLAYLTKLGLDAHAVDYQGNGLLHELAADRDVHQTYRTAETLAVWKILIEEYKLNLYQQNHAGQTPLHVMSKTATKYAPGAKSPMPVNLVLERMSGVDIQDYEGLTALHIAAGKSEWLTKLLLDAGANPRLAAHDGTTALHVAVAAREGNIVGMLLDSLRTTNGSDGLEDLGGMQPGNWHKRGNTPLELACRSGAPDIVRMLLDVGASTKAVSIYSECSSFEDNNEVWNRAARLDNGCGPPDSGLGPHEVARLEEILVMLAEHDANLDPLSSVYQRHGANLARLANVAARMQHLYTARCLYSFRRSLARPAEQVPYNKEELMPLISGEASASQRALEEFLDAKPDIDGRAIFKHLLQRREYGLVEVLFKRGICKLPQDRPDSREWNEFVLLVSHGFTQLVGQVGSSLAQAALGQGEWHAFGDPSKPGLWYAKREATQLQAMPKPFLIEALERNEPNMEMVRLLVEKFGVDVNEKLFEQDRMASGFPIVATDSALHHCAKGKTWWLVHQALPYLLQMRGIDIDLEIRNERRLTPLQLALSDTGGLWAVDAAKALIAAGADVNAATGDGSSCLSLARDDPVLTKLLIDHGAIVSPDAVISAAEKANVDVLRVLLASGIHPDDRRERPQESGSHETPAGNLCLEAHELYALHLAGENLMLPSERGLFGGRSQPSGAVETVQVLLEHGANPFSKFLLRRDEACGSALTYMDQGPRRPTIDVPDTHLEMTLLHDLISSRFDIRPFLRDGVDLEHRNAEGMTVLHRICLANAIEPEVIDTDGYDSENPYDRETTLDRMLSLGAKIDSRDYFGRNVLHCLLGGGDNRSREARLRTFRRILQKDPSLVHHADGAGETPFHYAVRQASRVHGAQVVPEMLLAVGANPSVLNNEGESVLHFLTTSLWEANRTLFEDLLARGLDVNLRDNRGRTPLFGFAQRPKTSSGTFGLFNPGGKPFEDPEAGALEMLQASGADFSVRDNKGRTLLHVAAAGSPARFKTLLNLGLDPMIEDDSQQTAIDVASANANTGVLQLFEKPGQAKGPPGSVTDI